MIRTIAWVRNNWKSQAVIVVAAMIAIAPMFWRGAPCEGDFRFHLVSWLDAQHSVVMALWNPHWANSANLGAGEPRFMFYPPLNWILGATLGMVLPWSAVPVLMLFLLLACTGLANRALAREAMDEGPATLAGCAAIFLGFALLTAYKRGAYGEMAGGLWVPLILLFLLRRRNPAGGVVASAFDGSVTPLALAVAGACLSNAPLAVMCLYVILGISLVSSLLERSGAPAVRAAAGLLLGGSVAGVYLIPAFVERGWINLRYAITAPHYRVENGWLFAHHADPKLYVHDILLRQVSWVAVGMLTVTVVGALIAWKRGRLPGPARWWIPLLLIAPAVLFLLLPVSLFVWNLLPELRILQFPWRWLVVLEAPMATFFAAAVWTANTKGRAVVAGACALVFVLIVAGVDHYWFMHCGNMGARIEESFYAGEGTSGKFEYGPPQARRAVVERELPSTCLLIDEDGAPGLEDLAPGPAWDGAIERCSGQFQVNFAIPEHKEVAGVADHAGYLVLRLRDYPAWKVTLNGQPVQAVPDSLYGLIAIPVPKGKVDVHVDWTTTDDVLVGRVVSVVAVFLLGLVDVAEGRRARRRLS
ncbi:MAG TPA: hypothetical protein VMD92_04710 [Acidobacteriaceae bacterium]|jgi:hypothetical protein|nr:hypothetical protein [Acidobacteriaceae bacterium]